MNEYKHFYVIAYESLEKWGINERKYFAKCADVYGFNNLHVTKMRKLSSYILKSEFEPVINNGFTIDEVIRHADLTEKAFTFIDLGYRQGGAQPDDLELIINGELPLKDKRPKRPIKDQFTGE